MISSMKILPLSVTAYRFLGESGLIPEKTEFLYGFIYKKAPKSPLHSFLVQSLHEDLAGGTLASAALPEFTLPLDALFAQ